MYFFAIEVFFGIIGFLESEVFFTESQVFFGITGISGFEGFLGNSGIFHGFHSFASLIPHFRMLRRHFQSPGQPQGNGRRFC